MSFIFRRLCGDPKVLFLLVEIWEMVNVYLQGNVARFSIFFLLDMASAFSYLLLLFPGVFISFTGILSGNFGYSRLILSLLIFSVEIRKKRKTSYDSHIPSQSKLLLSRSAPASTRLLGNFEVSALCNFLFFCWPLSNPSL